MANQDDAIEFNPADDGTELEESAICSLFLRKGQVSIKLEVFHFCQVPGEHDLIALTPHNQRLLLFNSPDLGKPPGGSADSIVL